VMQPLSRLRALLAAKYIAYRGAVLGARGAVLWALQLFCPGASTCVGCCKISTRGASCIAVKIVFSHFHRGKVRVRPHFRRATVQLQLQGQIRSPDREGQPRLETPPTTLLQPSPSARLDNLLQRGTQGTAAATGQPNTRAASRRPADVWRPPTMQAPRENPPAPRLPSAQAVANLLLFSRRRSPTGLGGSHGGGWPHVLHRPQQSGVY